jgi:tetratricopeptide (TPR) repeat protein
MTALLIGLLLTLSGVNPPASGPFEPANLDRAGRAYGVERYKEAFFYYEAALSKGEGSPGEILYNMGNCAYRLGRYAESLLHYRRAELRLPRDSRLGFNRSLAEEQLGLEKAPIESFAASVEELLDFLTPGEFLAAVGLLQGVGLVGLVLLRRRRGLRGVMIVVVLLALAGGARLVKKQWLPGPPAGVVLADRIAVRVEPHAEVVVLFELAAGVTVRVGEFSDRWAWIEHPRGKGWTERRGLGLVE